MEASELTPEQQADIAALVAEFELHITRVGVDMRAATTEMREIAPSVERRIADEEVEVSHAVDVGGIVETLRRLPDGAGTAAFVAAYNARRAD